MYVDALLLFSDAQAITATAASTSHVDFGSVRDVGAGEDLYVVVSCDVAMTDASSDSTVAVSVEGDSTTTFTPDFTRTLFTFSALSAAGTIKYAKLGPGDVNLRYLQLMYTVAGGNLTTGSFTAFMTNNIDKYVSYADNITIS